jgi:hypothetical protein
MIVTSSERREARSQQQATNMEVHAHSHTARKKWTHYIWEFLMLFLAVFCGFLAENQREHLVEHHRAKDYARSLLNDIRGDTSELRRGIHQTKFIISSIDSLVTMTSVMDINKPVPGTFYYYGKFMFNGFRIDWSKSTIDQLIQSGNLRYFRNRDLIGAINFYYYLQGIISGQNQNDMTHRDKILEIRNRILLSRYYAIFAEMNIVKEEYGHEYSGPIDSLMRMNLPLQKTAPGYLDEFINNITDRKSRLNLTVERYYPLAQEVAAGILELLMKEYHIK